MFKYIVNELPLDEGFTFITQDEVEGDIFSPKCDINKNTLIKGQCVFFSYWMFYELEIDYVASEFYNSTVTRPWRR